MKKFLILMFAIIHLNQHLVVKSGLFYLYDLDEEFWWRWPIPESNCSSNGYVGHEHSHLFGMGTPIAPEKGLFLTWHFSLFSSLYNRYKWSSRRTFDPEKASVFIIPYDLGLDGYVNKYTCQERQYCSDGLVKKLETYLLNNTYWQRHQGADHVVLWSLGQYHPWPRNGCDRFMKTFCSKCTFTCYWMDSSPSRARTSSASSASRNKTRDNRFISIPFPSAYHWWDNIKTLPWSFDHNATASSVTTAATDYSSTDYNQHGNTQNNRRHQHSHSNLPNSPTVTTTITTINPSMTTTTATIPIRNLTVVYLGSTQTLNPSHTKIRRAMTNQCLLSTIHCHWKRIAHSSKDTHIVEYVEIYKQAIFCLCPPGDDPARKAVFDALLSGCIPVIFEKATFYNQYFWHIPNEQTALDVSVYIPGNKIKTGNINMMNVLLKIPWKAIRLKQLAIEKLAPRLQYAIPPFHLLTNTITTAPTTTSTSHINNKNDTNSNNNNNNNNSNNIINNETTDHKTKVNLFSVPSATPPTSTSTWDPPFPDAAEIALDGFIARVHNILNNQSTSIPPLYMLQKRWNLKYEHVIVQIPH